LDVKSIDLQQIDLEQIDLEQINLEQIDLEKFKCVVTFNVKKFKHRVKLQYFFSQVKVT
jgi:uncharacterized protein YjbI with pentapeptide repeats